MRPCPVNNAMTGSFYYFIESVFPPDDTGNFERGKNCCSATIAHNANFYNGNMNTNNKNNTNNNHARLARSFNK